jgi:hypothetical protein
MAGNIYLIQNDKTLQPMTEQPYESEDVLQQLLENYPELLAGDQIDAAAPRRLILISREIGVPGEDQGFDRWSLDHLFIDQDGVPTLVEVKRGTDTRVTAMGSDFYKLTIFARLDVELRHGAPATTIRRGGSLSRDCARQPAPEDLHVRQRLSGLYRTAGTVSQEIRLCIARLLSDAQSRP